LALRESLDFDPCQHYHNVMAKLLDQALEAVRLLPTREQDEIARVIMQLAGSDPATPISLSAEEREAIARSKAAAGRGEFATDEQVRAVWAKHGL
jgi:ribulose-5-phosphate 4-epimerase/fuculose-1-phosphate aldolase